MDSKPEISDELLQSINNNVQVDVSKDRGSHHNVNDRSKNAIIQDLEGWIKGCEKEGVTSYVKDYDIKDGEITVKYRQGHKLGPLFDRHFLNVYMSTGKNDGEVDVIPM